MHALSHSPGPRGLAGGLEVAPPRPGGAPQPYDSYTQLSAGGPDMSQTHFHRGARSPLESHRRAPRQQPTSYHR